MADQAARYEVIDSDGHVIEPDSVWSEYAEPEFRELLPQGVGGYVQATGITRAYPDMPSSFLTGQGEDHWEAVAENTDWEEESKHKMARPAATTPLLAPSTWTPKASRSRSSTRPPCSPGSKRPTSSAPRAVPTTTGCTTTARPIP